MSNIELADMVEKLGYGEESDLEYYGHNFYCNRLIILLCLTAGVKRVSMRLYLMLDEVKPTDLKQ